MLLYSLRKAWDIAMFYGLDLGIGLKMEGVAFSVLVFRVLG